MIETIIKRNGTIEQFNPSKVNGWSEWAAKKLGSTVDWGSVVLEALSMCPNQCTSEYLQQMLINVCLSRKTWEYNRMAGRLYVKLIDRIVHPDGKPTVKQLHERLHQHGFMVKLNYSDEEYAMVEQMINHKQDLTYPHYQLHQLRFKYSLRNKVTKQEYETAQFVYMRLAMALAEDEPKETRMTDVQKWYTHFSKNRLNIPTPGFVNLGTKLNGYASCCLYTTDDTWPSLAAGDHIAYVMTCMSAGIGSHIKTRSVGDPVRGGLIEHSGKLPYYRAMVGAIGANLQNGRGGSSTVHYTAYDPEVEVIQKLRHPMTPSSKRIAGCHYSFGSNKLFARKVAKNEQYAPFSYYGNEELFNAQYSSDQTKFERLYNEWEAKAPFKLNARDVLLGAATQAYETGVHYMHMTDTLNTHTPFLDTIWMSNLCLTGDTLVDVKVDGFVSTIRLDLLNYLFSIGCKIEVLSMNINTNEKSYKPVTASALTGKNKKVMKITDQSTGNSIVCTPEHKIFTKNRGYVEAKNLKSTDELEINSVYVKKS